MSTPVTPVITNTIQQAQGQLDAGQLSNLISALQAANVISLPNDVPFANLQSFNLTILPNGGGKFNVTIRS